MAGSIREAMRHVTITEVRCILLASIIATVTYAAVLILANEPDPLGEWLAPSLFILSAVSSLVCVIRPSRLSLTLSAVGLVVGYLERAISVPMQILEGTLLVDTVRAWLPPATNTFISAVMAFLWIRIFLPVVELHVADRRVRQDA